MNSNLDEDQGWAEIIQDGDDPKFGLDIIGVDTTKGSIEIKPSDPSSMKFDGFDMREFFNL
jgi:hypothetical protein